MELTGQINFKDILDIVAVTFLIYQILFIVKGTRAVQMLFGVALLAVTFWIGHFYQLHTLNWILSHFFNSFFVIFIILFQDEIRSALASFGTGKKVFGSRFKTTKSSAIDEIVEAVVAMGRKKIGGIIVLERVQGLQNYVSTGTSLQSEIHADLLFALFQHQSPLHDGAVIISKDKILAAGCFLPLSKSIDVDRHLGTRHRASLGVSEATDAIVITVSEETGNITIAFAGEFYKIPDEDLHKAIRVSLGGKIPTDFKEKVTK